MARHNLKSYDAIHLTTAREHRLQRFAASDRELQDIRSPRI